MTHEQDPTPTIDKEAQAVETLLRSDDNLREAAEYFADATEQMKESASVIDDKKLLYVYDLLTRNLVNACNNAGDVTALRYTTDAYKEIISGGYELLGQDQQFIDEQIQSPAAALEQLQSDFSSTEELGTDYDPVLRVQLVDSLMFANANLLARPEEERERIIRHTSLRYYIDNVVAARARMEVL